MFCVKGESNIVTVHSATGVVLVCVGGEELYCECPFIIKWAVSAKTTVEIFGRWKLIWGMYGIAELEVLVSGIKLGVNIIVETCTDRSKKD